MIFISEHIRLQQTFPPHLLPSTFEPKFFTNRSHLSTSFICLLFNFELNSSRRKSRVVLHLFYQIRLNKTATSNDINVHASKCWNAILIATFFAVSFSCSALTTVEAQWEEKIMSSIRFRCKSDSILCTYSSSNAANMRKSLNYFPPRCDCVFFCCVEEIGIPRGSGKEKCWNDFNEIQIINYWKFFWGTRISRVMALSLRTKWLAKLISFTLLFLRSFFRFCLDKLLHIFQDAMPH